MYTTYIYFEATLHIVQYLLQSRYLEDTQWMEENSKSKTFQIRNGSQYYRHIIMWGNYIHICTMDYHSIVYGMFIN